MIFSLKSSYSVSQAYMATTDQTDISVFVINKLTHTEILANGTFHSLLPYFTFGKFQPELRTNYKRELFYALSHI